MSTTPTSTTVATLPGKYGRWADRLKASGHEVTITEEVSDYSTTYHLFAAPESWYAPSISVGLMVKHSSKRVRFLHLIVFQAMGRGSTKIRSPKRAWDVLRNTPGVL